MPAPLVSVVIPFLDPPLDFFREAIASVAAQDYRPFELILVNDGSRGPAGAFARGVADAGNAASGRSAGDLAVVRYVEHEGGQNRGSSASRNLGLSVAAGEYVAFLDADDVWAPGKLREQVACLRERPRAGMVFGHTRYWYSWRQGASRPGDDFIVRRGVERETAFEAPEFVVRFLRGRVIVPSSSNTMIRRDACLGCGGFEERFRGMYDDQAFLVKLGLEYPVAGVPRCWDSYRQHPQSMTARADAAGGELTARRDFLQWVRRYCLERGVRAPPVWEAINKERWLAGTGTRGTPDRRGRVVRRLKHWGLRAEELLLPAGIRQRLWARKGRPSA